MENNTVFVTYFELFFSLGKILYEGVGEADD